MENNSNMSKRSLKRIDYTKIIDKGTSPLFYKRLATKIITYIENSGSASFNDILKYVGGGERRVIRLLDQIVNLGILEFKLSKFYIPQAKDNYPFAISDVKCKQCDSKMVNINGKMKALLIFMAEIQKDMPKSTFIFDQRPVNAETVVRRVAYAIWRGDLQNKKIAVIGDDDLTSIALAKAGMAKEIVVFDIDERILSLINTISKSHNFNIKTVNQDLTKGLSSNYLNYFDTFITDPTPTTKSLSLFAIKGMQMLIKEPGKSGYISLYPSHMEMDIGFQKMVGKMNVLITDLIPFFNQYEIINHTLSENDIKLLKRYKAQGGISFCEYLMRIEATSSSKPLNLKFSNADLIGKATKQILNDPTKDPFLSQENGPKFIRDYLKNLKEAIKSK